jgi:hypothetical protein
MAKQYSNTFFSSLSKSSQNLSKFENCSFQKLKQLKHESKNQMTKNQKIIEDILTNQESTATATKDSLTVKIRSTEYHFKSFKSNPEECEWDTTWYFTSHSTFGNYSGVYGEDVDETGYMLKDDQLEIIQFWHKYTLKN